VYGTLRRGLRNHGLLAGATFVGAGTVAGVLHEVGTGEVVPYPYPALVVARRGRVRVELYRIPDRHMWAVLDALEHYRPADPAGSAYLRLRVDATLDDGTILPAQAYVFHGDPADLGSAVARGDWLAHRDAR
jgi:gamma-glutamylcyclotransferase (GGCT)/AIG2-like uncharacterized protein YtfP